MQLCKGPALFYCEVVVKPSWCQNCEASLKVLARKVPLGFSFLEGLFVPAMIANSGGRRMKSRVICRRIWRSSLRRSCLLGRALPLHACCPEAEYSDPRPCHMAKAPLLAIWHAPEHLQLQVGPVGRGKDNKCPRIQ